MSQKIDWKRVEYFIPQEFDDPNFPESGEKAHPDLVYKLNELRRISGCPLVTHWKVGGCVDVDGSHGHSKNSFHLLSRGAMASDFHFVTSMEPRKQYAIVESVGWGGIGVYYCWYWNGKLLPIAFHVDLRAQELTQRWVSRSKGDYVYLLGR